LALISDKQETIFQQS